VIHSTKMKIMTSHNQSFLVVFIKFVFKVRGLSVQSAVLFHYRIQTQYTGSVCVRYSRYSRTGCNCCDKLFHDFQ